MSYILAVNPAIMAQAGLDFQSCIFATALVSIVGCLLVAFLSDLPLAVGPGMGANTIFVYSVVKQAGVPWQAGLALIVATGMIFFLLSVSRMRAFVATQLPAELRIGMEASTGALIGYIGLRMGGVIVSNPATLTGFGNVRESATVLALLGIILTYTLSLAKIRGGMIISIAVVTVCGLFTPRSSGQMMTVWPARLLERPAWPHSTAFQIDFHYALSHILLLAPLLFYFVCSEFFGTMGTLVGTTEFLDIPKEKNVIPGMTGAFVADALATVAGGFLGTSTAACFLESVSGIVAGGRTGLTALVTALCFCLSLFMWPLLTVIPPEATASALVLVGIQMMGSLARLEKGDFSTFGPPAAMVILTILAGNIIYGMWIGVVLSAIGNFFCSTKRGPMYGTWLFGGLMTIYVLSS